MTLFYPYILCKKNIIFMYGVRCMNYIYTESISIDIDMSYVVSWVFGRFYESVKISTTPVVVGSSAIKRPKPVAIPPYYIHNNNIMLLSYYIFIFYFSTCCIYTTFTIIYYVIFIIFFIIIIIITKKSV